MHEHPARIDSGYYKQQMPCPPHAWRQKYDRVLKQLKQVGVMSVQQMASQPPAAIAAMQEDFNAVLQELEHDPQGELSCLLQPMSHLDLMAGCSFDGSCNSGGRSFAGLLTTWLAWA